jgi:hypothetical protein
LLVVQDLTAQQLVHLKWSNADSLMRLGHSFCLWREQANTSGHQLPEDSIVQLLWKITLRMPCTTDLSSICCQWEAPDPEGKWLSFHYLHLTGELQPCNNI